MNLRSLVLIPLLAPALAGCGASIYHPRPSPRIQVTTEGSSLVLVRDGRAYGMGVFGDGIEEAVKGNARAEEEAHTYQTRGTAGFVLGLLGSLTSGAGAGLLVGNEVQQDPSTTLRGVSLGMLFGGLAVGIIGNVLTNSAQPHLWNAVNLYNDGLPPGYAPGYGYGAPPYPGGPLAPRYAPPGYAPPATMYVPPPATQPAPQAPPGSAPQAPPGYAPPAPPAPPAAPPPQAPAPPAPP